jgi:hypothetical protein
MPAIQVRRKESARGVAKRAFFFQEKLIERVLFEVWMKEITKKCTEMAGFPNHVDNWRGVGGKNGNRSNYCGFLDEKGHGRGAISIFGFLRIYFWPFLGLFFWAFLFPSAPSKRPSNRPAPLLILPLPLPLRLETPSFSCRYLGYNGPDWQRAVRSGGERAQVSKLWVMLTLILSPL